MAILHIYYVYINSVYINTIYIYIGVLSEWWRRQYNVVLTFDDHFDTANCGTGDTEVSNDGHVTKGSFSYLSSISFSYRAGSSHTP